MNTYEYLDNSLASCFDTVSTSNGMYIITVASSQVKNCLILPQLLQTVDSLFH